MTGVKVRGYWWLQSALITESLADVKESVRTAVLIAKKSTANQRQTAFCWWLIVTVTVLLIPFARLLSRIEVENCHFPYPTLIVDPIGEMLSNTNVIYTKYTSLKSTISGLQFCRLQYGSTFIRVAAIATKICEISWNSNLLQFNVIQGHQPWC